jgi:GntR family transcriptional regulator
MLVNDGYVYVHHGKGTFVIRSEMSQGPVAVLNPSDMAPECTETPCSRVMSVETVVADALLAERLRILPGDKVVRLEHAECVAGIPVVLAVSWLPYEVCADVLNSGGPCESLPAVLDKSLGVALRQTEETVRAALATPHELELLELPSPAALLLVHRTTYDAQGRIVEHARVAYRADHYRIDLPPKTWQ